MSGPVYGGFAQLYDGFMADVDYDGWMDYIFDMFGRFGVSPGLALDLGCGTGSAAIRLKKRGCDVVGVDASPDMLSVAMAKDPGILWLNQDIRAFELYGTVDVIVSLCDVMNYVLSAKGLASVFGLARNYLNPGGLFVFDMNTLHKYRHVLGNRVFLRETDGAFIAWDNRFYERERINEYRLTCFKRRDAGLYERFRERHLQRAYAIKTVRRLLEGAGLEVAGVYADRCFLPPDARTERVFFAAKRP